MVIKFKIKFDRSVTFCEKKFYVWNQDFYGEAPRTPAYDLILNLKTVMNIITHGYSGVANSCD